MASKTSLIGALGLGKQTAKGTAQSTFHYIPTTSLNLQTQQQAQNLPPEIGGDFFLRGSYKSSVSAGGDIGFVVRADGLGFLLDMLAGAHQTQALTSSSGAIADPATALTLTPGTGGTLQPGVWTAAYSWISASGETQLSPTATVTLTPGNQTIAYAALPTLPTGATGVNFYVSLSVGNPTLGFSATAAANTAGSLTAAGDPTHYIPLFNSTGTATDGTYVHVFNPFAPSPTADLPWYTVQKYVSGLWTEQYTDTKLNSLRLDFSKQQVVTGTANFFGITPAETANPTLPLTMDSGYNFTALQATVNLTDESGVLTLPATALQAERISFDFGNQLSQDEYYIGSASPADITLLQRTMTMSYDLVIRDKVLREAVYQNGGTSAWSPTIWRGNMIVDVVSSANIPGATRPYELKVIIPGLDFTMMPIQMSGAQLIRANVSAQLTLGAGGKDRFYVAVVNQTASY